MDAIQVSVSAEHINDPATAARNHCCLATAHPWMKCSRSQLKPPAVLSPAQTQVLPSQQLAQVLQGVIGKQLSTMKTFLGQVVLLTPRLKMGQ